MSQYFSNDNSVKNKNLVVNFKFFDKEISLESNYGVFSKDRLDQGSNIFIRYLLTLNIGESTLWRINYFNILAFVRLTIFKIRML